MNKLMNKIYFSGLSLLGKAKKAMTNENGETNLIAIILILAIVIVLVIVFKNRLTGIVNNIWNKIGGDVNSALR